MASSKPAQAVAPPPPALAPAPAQPRKRRVSRLVLAWVVVLALGAIAFFWDEITGYARTGASYGARVACSCHYVGGRSLSDCRKDFEPGMGLVVLSEDAEAKSITARFPLISTQTATFREGEGCRLDPWDN